MNDTTVPLTEVLAGHHAGAHEPLDAVAADLDGDTVSGAHVRDTDRVIECLRDALDG